MDTAVASAPRTTWARWWDEAVAPRLLIIRYLPAAGSGLVMLLTIVNLLLGLLPVAFIVATSVVVGRVPDALAAGLGSSAWDGLVVAFLVAAALFVIQQAFVPAQTALGELAKRRVDGYIHDRIMGAALSSTGIGPMEDQAALDALKEASRRLDGNWETPGMACAGMLALIARYTRLVGFVIMVGLVASWLPAAALFVATMIFRYGNRGGLRKYSQAWSRVIGEYRHATYLRDLALHARAAKELRVFGLTAWLADRYATRYRSWLAPVWKLRRRIYLLPYLGYTALGLAVACVTFAVLARGAAEGGISLTELALGLQATVAALLLGAYYPESDDATQLGMLAATGLSRFERRVSELDATAVALGESASPPDPGQGPIPVVAGSADPATVDPATVSQARVRFAGVGFRYPGSSRDVLNGLELELTPGRCTALVGVNGAGKTTIVKLLARLYEPTAGAVRFGGHDIREFSVDAWRRQISVILQDFVRYELSVADNVAFGAPHVPRDEGRILRALERAGLGEVVAKLPRGLDTPLSRAYAGGADLSGGQWQRVAIARSLYALDAGARILVLDEPTSALDVRAETEFFDQFVELTEGVTSLLISHRFSSVRRADTIVVIDGGQVIEQGSHDELMAADGRYAELFRLQADWFARGLDAEGQIIDPELKTDPAER